MNLVTKVAKTLNLRFLTVVEAALYVEDAEEIRTEDAIAAPMEGVEVAQRGQIVMEVTVSLIQMKVMLTILTTKVEALNPKIRTVRKRAENLILLKNLNISQQASKILKISKIPAKKKKKIRLIRAMRRIGNQIMVDPMKI